MDEPIHIDFTKPGALAEQPGWGFNRSNEGALHSALIRAELALAEAAYVRTRPWLRLRLWAGERVTALGRWLTEYR